MLKLQKRVQRTVTVQVWESLCQCGGDCNENLLILLLLKTGFTSQRIMFYNPAKFHACMSKHISAWLWVKRRVQLRSLRWVHLWNHWFWSYRASYFTIYLWNIEIWCCLVTHISALEQMALWWCNLHQNVTLPMLALSDDIQFMVTPHLNLELWSQLCLQNVGMLGKCSHPHLLNEEDSGDGTCTKLQLYLLSSDINICGDTPYNNRQHTLLGTCNVFLGLPWRHQISTV